MSSIPKGQGKSELFLAIHISCPGKALDLAQRPEECSWGRGREFMISSSSLVEKSANENPMRTVWGLKEVAQIPTGAQQGQSFIEPSFILSYVSGFYRGLKNRVVNEAGEENPVFMGLTF